MFWLASGPGGKSHRATSCWPDGIFQWTSQLSETNVDVIIALKRAMPGNSCRWKDLSRYFERLIFQCRDVGSEVVAAVTHCASLRLELLTLCIPRRLSRLRLGCPAWDVIETWLILPVVICLSQRLSHACLSISFYTAKLRMAH